MTTVESTDCYSSMGRLELRLASSSRKRPASRAMHFILKESLYVWGCLFLRDPTE
jgi:hypothetical protein